MADATRLQKSIDIASAWGGEPIDATVFGCNPDAEQPCLRNRTTLTFYGGPFGLTLKLTHTDALALAALITKAAETIPEGLRS